jgi:hypothetical protein
MNIETKVKYKVIDNFLPKDLFIKIKNFIMGNEMPWYYQSEVSKHNEKNLNFYFMHMFFSDRYGMSHYYLEILPIIKIIKPQALLRVKGNLYTKTKKLIQHDEHVDFHFKHKGFLLYINTNNGYTKLKDGTKIESIENRALFFDSSVEHSSTNCTNEQIRVNININYI